VVVVRRKRKYGAPENVKKTLDLGCGTGDSWHSLRLPVEHQTVVGIDIQLDRLRISNLKYAERMALSLRS
jgi:ubiquinone/menaquinone biosynthesis C-methylase UbiE